MPRAAAQSADIDKSGFVDKEELGRVIKVQLNVQLQDPINDLDIIFGMRLARQITPAIGRAPVF